MRLITDCSLFDMLNKRLYHKVIYLILFLLPIFNQPLFAQTNNNETLLTIEELVVNTGMPSPFQPLVRVVAVIERDEIEKKAVQNIQDLLRYLQGADIRSRGSEGVQADINILGGTFDQTMVMINGINFTDPQTGHHSLNIPVDISQIQRVELLHGPGAWSEGSVAYSGAINIITKQPVNNSIDATISAGDYGYLRKSLNAGFASSQNKKGWKLSGQAGGSHSKSNGYSENTDFGITGLYSGIHLSNQRGESIDFQAGYQQKAFGANSFYSIAYPEQFEKTRVLISSLKYLRQTEKWQFSTSIYHRRHHDRFELFRNESPDWYTGHNYHMTDVAGISAKAAYKWKKAGSTVLGAEYRYENIFSTVLGDLLNSPLAVPGESGIFFSKSKTRQTPSVYLRHIIQLNKWRFTGGIMSANTLNSGETENYNARLYAGLATAYTITPYLEANGWINNSYRNPTFTDLYYRSPTQTGNSSLKPEEAVAAQIALKYTRFNIRAYVSSFYRYGYRIIDWTRESGSDQWKASNITNVKSAGIDLSASLYVNRGPLSFIGISYSHSSVAKQSSGLHSLYATDYLRHKASLGVHHHIISQLNCHWDFSYQKRNGTYLGPQNTEIPYSGFVLADLKLVWNGKHAHPFIEATNLFNTNYLQIGNIPQPRRWLKAGLNIRLSSR